MSARERKKRQVRRQWLQAGQVCFARDGYELTTLERLATEAGLSRPGFFLYYPSKAQLRTALRLEQLHALATLAGQEADRAGSPAEKLHRALLRMTRHVQAEAALLQAINLLGCGFAADEGAEQESWLRLAAALAGLSGVSPQGMPLATLAGLLRGSWQQAWPGSASLDEVVYPVQAFLLALARQQIAAA